MLSSSSKNDGEEIKDFPIPHLRWRRTVRRKKYVPGRRLEEGPGWGDEERQEAGKRLQQSRRACPSNTPALADWPDKAEGPQTDFATFYKTN